MQRLASATLFRPVNLSTCQPLGGHIHGETRGSGLSIVGRLVGRSVSRPVGQSVRWLAAVQVPFG
ncbi:hypothetical protein BC831DRAFT_446214, partial [Entophlyctis helioformis]